MSPDRAMLSKGYWSIRYCIYKKFPEKTDTETESILWSSGAEEGGKGINGKMGLRNLKHVEVF